MYAFEEYLRPWKGSDNLERNFMLWKESVALEDGLKGQHEGSCQVSDKLSNSRGYLWLFSTRGRGYIHKGVITIVFSKGNGK